jgi:hypothetical protein
MHSKQPMSGKCSEKGSRRDPVGSSTGSRDSPSGTAIIAGLSWSFMNSLRANTRIEVVEDGSGTQTEL